MIQSQATRISIGWNVSNFFFECVLPTYSFQWLSKSWMKFFSNRLWDRNNFHFTFFFLIKIYCVTLLHKIRAENSIQMGENSFECCPDLVDAVMYEYDYNYNWLNFCHDSNKCKRKTNTRCGERKQNNLKPFYKYFILDKKMCCYGCRYCCCCWIKCFCKSGIWCICFRVCLNGRFFSILCVCVCVFKW